MYDAVNRDIHTSVSPCLAHARRALYPRLPNLIHTFQSDVQERIKDADNLIAAAIALRTVDLSVETCPKVKLASLTLVSRQLWIKCTPFPHPSADLASIGQDP